MGFGEGRCLIELRNMFPDKKLELYGINNIKKGNMHSKKDFYNNAKELGIDIKQTNLPTPFFYDVGKGLHFEDNYFDVVFSQVSIPYVGDKITLFEEIWRTLKTEGKAFLHIDGEIKEGSPDFMYFKKDTPRFIIYNEKGKIISSINYFNKIREKGYDIKLFRQKTKKTNFLLTMHKNKDEKLDFNLVYDGTSTLYLTLLKETDEYKTQSGIWWGTCSVYKIKK
ncbi:MAG: methyltransferase domain-containing protein [Candidatus Woesearchaeota archaeon]